MLHLNLCQSLTDLDPLRGHPSLTELELMFAPGLADLSPLREASRLRVLRVSFCPSLPDGELAALQSSLPALTVVQ